MAQPAVVRTVPEGWNPEDAEHWDSRLAWRTLAVTTFSLVIAFCVWYLVSAVALLTWRPPGIQSGPRPAGAGLRRSTHRRPPG